MKKFFLACVMALGLVAPVDAATLYVNINSGSCSDATAKASNTSNTPWCNLYRAVWGSTNRSAQNASEAAAADDIVLVTGGTYNTTVSLGSRNSTAYNTANDGTSGHQITFRCIGVCKLTGLNVKGVALGQGDNYITWIADIANGSYWEIPMCSTSPITGAECTDSATITAMADYPSVMCGGATGLVLDGFYIYLTQPVQYLDNTNGMRLEGCQSSTVRNIQIRNIKYTSESNHNRSCITVYHSNGNTVEHIDCDNAESGLFFKDTSTTSPVLSGNVFRYNLFRNITGECMVWSLVNGTSVSGANYITQNICDTTEYGIRFIGSGVDGARNDVIAHNLFIDTTVGISLSDVSGGFTGVRIYGNIFRTGTTVITMEGSYTFPSATLLDLEHNVYSNYGTFYSSGSDGTRTFSGFNTAYADQHNASPTAVTSTPLFPSEASNDFRICTATNVPVGCSGASPAVNLAVDIRDLDNDGSTVDLVNAGPYLTNNEAIGLEQATPAATIYRLRFRGN